MLLQARDVSLFHLLPGHILLEQSFAVVGDVSFRPFIQSTKKFKHSWVSSEFQGLSWSGFITIKGTRAKGAPNIASMRVTGSCAVACHLSILGTFRADHDFADCEAAEVGHGFTGLQVEVRCGQGACHF